MRVQTYSYLLATDSMSTLAALESGPIDQHEPICVDIWRTLVQLADLGVHMRLQFVYSHCGVPRNEAADAAAKAARGHGEAQTSSWWRDAARYTFTRNVEPPPPRATEWCTGRHELSATTTTRTMTCARNPSTSHQSTPARRCTYIRTSLSECRQPGTPTVP
eukprot:PhM_4_TR9771/c2_g1_i1/m.38534